MASYFWWNCDPGMSQGVRLSRAEFALDDGEFVARWSSTSFRNHSNAELDRFWGQSAAHVLPSIEFALEGPRCSSRLD